MLLNKWLDYCTGRGHCFAAVPAAAGGGTHEPA
jgi:uncharacterized protein YqiB (DUF1249 family)